MDRSARVYVRAKTVNTNLSLVGGVLITPYASFRPMHKFWRRSYKQNAAKRLKVGKFKYATRTGNSKEEATAGRVPRTIFTETCQATWYETTRSGITHGSLLGLDASEAR